MAILSTSEILDYISRVITAKYPTIDSQIGTDLYDLIFAGNAQVASRIFEEISRVEDLQSIFTTTGTDLDLVARNYNITRKNPTFASGNITFFTGSFTSDIVIPDNSALSTTGTINLQGISFKTIGDFSMLFNNKSEYFNADNGRYEITVPIQATVSDVDGNQGIGQISVIQTNIPQIEGCTNLAATTGGQASETDTNLQQRAALSWIVSAIGTKDGYKKLLTDLEYVTDAVAVGPFETESVREGVDIYAITTSALSTSTKSIIYNNDAYTTLDNQPVVDLATVRNKSLAPVQLLLHNVSYTLNKQISNPLAGSATSDSTTARIDWITPWVGSVATVTTQPNTFTFPNSGDMLVTSGDAYKNTRVKFTSGLNIGLERTVIASSYDLDANIATVTTNNFPNNISATDDFILDPRPNIGDSIETLYSYNPDIAVIQSFVEQSQYNVVGANILIKVGHRAALTLTGSISVFPQYNFDTVLAKVENALNQYISSFKLGDDLHLSDLIVVGQTGLGTDFTIVEVDFIDFETAITLSYATRWDGVVSGFDGDGVLAMDSREYIELSTLTIT